MGLSPASRNFHCDAEEQFDAETGSTRRIYNDGAEGDVEEIWHTSWDYSIFRACYFNSDVTHSALSSCAHRNLECWPTAIWKQASSLLLNILTSVLVISLLAVTMS